MQTEDPALKELLDRQQSNIREYNKESRLAGHDDLKLTIAGMVNEHMLHEVAEQTKALPLPEKGKVPTTKDLKQMQNWAHKYKRKYPWKNAEEVARATAARFKVNLLDAPPDTTNPTTPTNGPADSRTDDTGAIPGQDTGDEQHL